MRLSVTYCAVRVHGFSTLRLDPGATYTLRTIQLCTGLPANEPKVDGGYAILHTPLVVAQHVLCDRIDVWISQEHRKFGRREHFVGPCDAGANIERHRADRIGCKYSGECPPDDESVLLPGNESIQGFRPCQERGMWCARCLNPCEYFRQQLLLSELSIG